MNAPNPTRHAAEEIPMASKHHPSKTRKPAGATAAKYPAVGPAGSHPSATYPRAQP